ncbi:DegT/DnrJ/EryC1/StrS family aminotransferase [Candidatus Magnetaquicoccus inordinatus]|uniref:DegT/DnrJ/EryC1/StrS family aminotransferase n=1 Tax=Candidatus Magnetaquicoccus inordinatus TaxID=2496818 RepID=UPI00102C79DF|nr:DegT/DnrJ/EryC1/StrS aminotransferase family protein [Candidatus Magnetaquicoccus inordinatus]
MAEQCAAVPFADLSIQWQAIRERALPDLLKLFESSEYCLGSWVSAFERDFAQYVGSRHAVAVNSGTSALHLALLAAGIGPGDRVILPSHTFVATLWAVLYVGAEPILCDIDPRTGTMDVEDARRRMLPGCKAIMPVHLYGQPVDMQAVLALAQEKGLLIIEDVAQAHGARFAGRSVGSIGSYGCFSFYPGKNLGAAGEGGMVVTEDGQAAEKMRALRNHGQYQRWIHQELGYNYRMEGIQGLILGHKLPLLPGWTDERRRIAKRYEEGLADLPLLLPRVLNHDHVFHLYVIRTPQREGLRRYLEERLIQTGIHYPIPVHRQPCYTQLQLRLDAEYPQTDLFTEQCLSLPLFVGMSDAQIERVVAAIRDYFAEGSRE